MGQAGTPCRTKQKPARTEKRARGALITHQHDPKHLPPPLRLPDDGQAPRNEEEAQHGEDDADDPADDAAGDDVAHDAEDGQRGADAEDDVHADAAQQGLLVGRLERVGLPGEGPAAAHVGAVAVFEGAACGRGGGAGLAGVLCHVCAVVFEDVRRVFCCERGEGNRELAAVGWGWEMALYRNAAKRDGILGGRGVFGVGRGG